MKKLMVLPFLALLWACGGAGDDKNAADNYPTYDTASTPCT